MYEVVNAYLENGLKVILHRIPEAKTFACGLWVKQGSSNENDENNGLSHLTEHLLLNPQNPMSPKFGKLMSEIASNGVMYNAATTKEYTCFYFTGLERLLEKCLKALALMSIENREFEDDFFENEKRVVLQEATSFYSSFQQIKERTSQAIWGNIGIGRIIMGDMNNISSANLESINEIIENSYVPNNSILVVIGNIDYTETLNIISNYFEDWRYKKILSKESAVEKSPGIYINTGSGKSAVISIGFRTVPYNEPNRTTVDMMVRMLGHDGLQARLIQEIRMKRGLSYNLGGFTSFYRRHGTIGFMAVSDKTKITEIAKLTSEVINDVKENGFADDEIAREKCAMETSLLLEVDNITDHLRYIGKCSVMEEDFFVENEVRAIKDVTGEQLREVVRNSFTEDNLGVAVIGDVDSEELISNISIA